MWEDPVVEAVREVREGHAAQFDYDLQAIYQALKQEEAQSGHKFVKVAPKRTETDKTAHPRSEPSAA